MIYDLLHSTGQDFTAAQRERAQEDFKVLFKGAPPHPPPIRIRKTATAPGSPYSFRIVRGFFYVPQNYQHSRNCETGPPTYRPYPRRLESLTICRWYYKGSTFSSVILRPWVLVWSEYRTHDLPRHSPVHNQVSYRCAVAHLSPFSSDQGYIWGAITLLWIPRINRTNKLQQLSVNNLWWNKYCSKDGCCKNKQTKKQNEGPSI